MKSIFTFLLLLALFAPFGAYAQESLHTEQLEFSLEENGNWTLADLVSEEIWRGEWIDIFTMKVTGSDNSCFLITENEHGMVQLDCEDMTETDILIPNESTTQEPTLV